MQSPGAVKGAFFAFIEAPAQTLDGEDECIQ